jgi:hypothetical protein
MSCVQELNASKIVSMPKIEGVLRRLEAKLASKPTPRLVFVNEGESNLDALGRMELGAANLERKNQDEQKFIFVRWAQL